MTTLGQFMKEQKELRNLDNTQFARLIGVSKQVVGTYLLHDHSKETWYGKGKTKRKVGDPPVEFIEKLSRATQTDAGYILSLVRPSCYFASDLKPDTRWLAKEIQGLPDEALRSIHALIQVWAVSDAE